MKLPNIILLALDSLRATRLGCYGYSLPTSPHLDRIASQGVLFEDCFSCHIPTHPAFTTLFTGKDAFGHQIVCQGGDREPPPGVRMLAEILQEMGYYTVAADILEKWFARGFEEYAPYPWQPNPWKSGGFRKGESVNQVALPLLERCVSQDRPFFLFAHYWDTHTPYLPPPPFDRLFYHGNEKDPENRSMDPVLASMAFRNYFTAWMGDVTDIRYWCAQYDGEIAYMDVCLAAFFHRMEELGLMEDTLLAILSDHGEELDEHGCYFDHHGLYDNNLHVPLILHWPARFPEGMRIPGQVRLTDFAPTLLDAIGAGEAIGSSGMTGRSLLPGIGGGSSTAYSHLFLTESTWMRKRGIRTNEWKLIVAAEPDFRGLPPIELYHLTTDPEERCNLAKERPEVVDHLRGELETWIERRREETGLPDPLSYQKISLRKLG